MAWLRSAFAAISILIGGLGAAGAAGAAPALWVVRDANSEIYLFGTLHALDPATQWRTPLYDQAYARSQTVWFEADIDRADPMTVNNIVARYGVDPDRPLSQKLPARELEALRSQVDVRRIDHLRPWAAALMLSMQPILGKGARVEAGADLTVAREARGQAKTIRTFESLEDQARLFTSFTRASNVGHRPGTGLGLVIVQRCVQKHGGEITLDSVVGVGTTVTILLPVFAAAAEPAPTGCALAS